MIKTKDLTKRYGRTVAVDAVDLDVREGDRYGLLGPNGSGKTTLVRMLLGLVFATRGEIEVLGLPVPKRVPAALPALPGEPEREGEQPLARGPADDQRIARLAVVEDLAQPSPPPVLANHVRGDAVLRARTSEQKGERRAQQARESLHHADCILAR